MNILNMLILIGPILVVLINIIMMLRDIMNSLDKIMINISVDRDRYLDRKDAISWYGTLYNRITDLEKDRDGADKVMARVMYYVKEDGESGVGEDIRYFTNKEDAERFAKEYEKDYGEKVIVGQEGDDE